MPEMPAVRPLNTHRMVTAMPRRAPPIAALSGVKCSIGVPAFRRPPISRRKRTRQGQDGTGLATEPPIGHLVSSWPGRGAASETMEKVGAFAIHLLTASGAALALAAALGAA